MVHATSVGMPSAALRNPGATMRAIALLSVPCPASRRRSKGVHMDLPLRPITRRIAVIGNHLPRRCGIATFTTDLTDALAHADPASSYRVLAMDDVAEGYDYPPRVTAALAQNDLIGYRRA